MQYHLPRWLWALAVLSLLRTAAAEERWPQFRGPSGLGYTAERDLPVTWDEKDRQHVLWSVPLVGQGHASPIVWGDRIFVCTAHWPESVTQREKVIPEQHVLCYAAGDGKLLWDVQVPPGPWLRSDFRSGPGGGYACPTPTTDGRLVYCVFGSSVVAALDFSGRIVWRKEITPTTFDVTIGSSPLLWHDSLILLCAMANKSDSRVFALQKATGNMQWDEKFPQMGFGHSTPLLIEAGGRPQLLVLASGMGKSADALQALDPGSGRRLWWCWGAGDAASPAWADGIVYFDSGRGGPGVAVRPGGEGDVSAANTLWKIDTVPEAIGSPVIVGGRVYRLLGSGVLKCWDAATGKPVYSARLEGPTTTWASPIVDPQGRIFYASAGRSFVVQAGSEFKLLATNDLGDPNHASAAVGRGKLFLVGTKRLWCVGR